MKLHNQFLHLPQVPDIAGKTENVWFLFIDFLQKIRNPVVDGILCNLDKILIFLRICF